MTKIIIKNGTGTNLKQLDTSEMALTTDTNNIYIGNNSNNILIGGKTNNDLITQLNTKILPSGNVPLLTSVTFGSNSPSITRNLNIGFTYFNKATDKITYNSSTKKITINDTGVYWYDLFFNFKGFVLNAGDVYSIALYINDSLISRYNYFKPTANDFSFRASGNIYIPTNSTNTVHFVLNSPATNLTLYSSVNQPICNGIITKIGYKLY